MSSRIAILEALRAGIRGVECADVERPRSYLPSACAELDRVLPGGGLQQGSFIEVLSEHDGCGAFSLALRLARTALAQRPAWVVVDTERSFYPPAAAQAGLHPDHLTIIQTEPRRAAWAFAQLLRSPALGACFLFSRSMDNMNFRRFQLAAERGGGLGFVIRPMEAAKRPCWASVRLKIQRDKPEAGETPALRVTLLHVRHGKPSDAGASVALELSA